MDHCQERKTQRTDAYCNCGGVRFPTIGPALPGNSYRAIPKKALRSKFGPRFCGAVVANVLADGCLYVAIHAYRRRQKNVWREGSVRVASFVEKLMIHGPLWVH